MSFFDSWTFFGLFLTASLFLIIRGLLLTEAAIFLRLSHWGRSHLISLIDIKRSHWAHDAGHFVFVSLVDAFIYVFFFKHQWIALTALSAQSFFWSFAFMFVWSEIWFYFAHRALHWAPLFSIHRVHHASTQPNPFTANAFSTTERVLYLSGLLAVVALASHSRPFCLEGLMAYLILSTVGMIIEHSHIEVLSKQFRLSFMGRWIVSPSDHSAHHAKTHVNFGLFTNFFDQWLKTKAP